MMADMASIERKKAKTIFLGLCYGMGSGKLAKNLGLPTTTARRPDGSTYLIAGQEGQALFDRFDNAVPFVRLLARRCERRAALRGFITTLLGRRCRFPVNVMGQYEWTHKALNRLIQGSSADQTKLAMVEIDAAGEPIHIQVHDEIGTSVQDRAQARRIADIMETCIPLRVPSKVDIELGPNWGEAV
jgi:DNA polymerase I-like protein with 3'-5' exonuclease and polymerase domains